MSIQEIKSAVDAKALPVAIAEKYLRLYVADVSWENSIASLWKNSINKFKDEELAKEHVKKAISCATLLPWLEKTTIPDPPTNLIFWCTGWAQFSKHDWFSMYLETLEQDLKITELRNSLIKIGVIDKVDLSPITRQAYNWLYQKAEENEDLGSLDLEKLKTKFINLIKAYGGAVVCNMFVKYKNNVDKVFNWRSGYFFEKEIHKVYTYDQLMKIKSAEMLKTNKKYINTINDTGAGNARQYSF